MHNMEIWEALCRPDPKHLKPITAGRLRGKSDINPQWRIKAMTEYFGPCGDGWKFTIDRLWTEPGADGEVMCFAQIGLYWILPDGTDWLGPIPGLGGSTLVQKESKGMYNNDEAFKMALTDALGVAFKMLGVAADVYLGLFQDSKYVTAPEAEVRQESARKEKERLDTMVAGMAILEVAAERGHEALVLAWKTLSEAMREACKSRWGEMKNRAVNADLMRKAKEVAHVEE